MSCPVKQPRQAPSSDQASTAFRVSTPRDLCLCFASLLHCCYLQYSTTFHNNTYFDDPVLSVLCSSHNWKGGCSVITPDPLSPARSLCNFQSSLSLVQHTLLCTHSLLPQIDRHRLFYFPILGSKSNIPKCRHHSLTLLHVHQRPAWFWFGSVYRAFPSLLATRSDFIRASKPPSLDSTACSGSQKP